MYKTPKCSKIEPFKWICCRDIRLESEFFFIFSVVLSQRKHTHNGSTRCLQPVYAIYVYVEQYGTFIWYKVNPAPLAKKNLQIIWSVYMNLRFLGLHGKFGISIVVFVWGEVHICMAQLPKHMICKFFFVSDWKFQLRSMRAIFGITYDKCEW